jgi:8-oxo-dGTP pyrophosphatase MutT (NUDIX family)
MTNPFKLKSSREIYKNPWISVREDSVKNGEKDWIFWIVTMHNGTCIIAIDEENNVLLSREYKYALGRYDHNLPGWAIDPWETPLECARREMEEEIGYQADEWISLGYIHPLTTLLEQTENLFLARKLKKTKNHEDEWEKIEVIKIPYPKALEMVINSEITHGWSVVAILKAQQFIHPNA